MSTMRIGGLASGMDIDSIVEKLMTVERMPLDKLEQQKQTYEWQRDAYRDVNTKLQTLDTYIADNLIIKSLNGKTATSSNTKFVSATATGSATGTLSIEGVSQLATAARGVGTQINANGATKLSALFEEGEIIPTSIKLSAIDKQGKLIEPVTIEITGDMTVSDFVNKINASGAGVSAIFESGRLSITAKNTGREVNGGNAITTDENGSLVFAKFNLNNLVTEEGKNAIFQVNGIATERTTNTFSINGYSVTLNSVFNADRTAEENYNAALIEFKNTSSTEYNASINDANDDKIQATTAYDTALANYKTARNTLFGTVEVSANETSAYNKVYNKLTSEELGTIDGMADFATNEDYTAWLEDNTTHADLKTKLKNNNVTFAEFNVLKTIDFEKINSIKKQNLFNAIGSSFINDLSDKEKEEILKLELATIDSQIQMLKDSEDPDLSKLGTKLASITDDELKSTLANITTNDLTDYTMQAAYNTLGAAFLGNLSDAERTLLNRDGDPFTLESLNTQIDTWKNSKNATEKALADNLAKLNDTQKSTLISFNSTELQSLTNVASLYLDSQAKLQIKNTKEAEHQALVDRQNKAKVNFEYLYGSPLPTEWSEIEALPEKSLSSSPTDPVTMTSTANVDEMITKIKDFVNTYNGLIKDLNNLTKESKYRDFPPLTSEQRKDMEENEIKLWEEKAKSGLLRGDSIIQGGLSSMRNLIYQSNDGVLNTKFNTLYSIGITSSRNYMEGGTLEIDENKLRKALEEDPDAVATLFSNPSGKVVKEGNVVVEDTRGYLQKLRGSFDEIQQKIETRAGRSTMTQTQYTLGKYLKNVEDQMDNWQDKLRSIENRYWAQFGAMESMINKANSQSAMLMGQYY